MVHVIGTLPNGERVPFAYPIDAPFVKAITGDMARHFVSIEIVKVEA